jgi:ABC-type multidrug transport system fused ATPase/permease subunit
LIEFIENKDSDPKDGVWLVIVFGLSAFIGQISKNYSYFLSYLLAVKIRKTLMSSLYDKLGKVTMESIIKTNSGKIITIISSDIFAIEKQLIFVPLPFIAPLLNAGCFIYIGFKAAWYYSLALVGLVILITISQ